MDILIDEVLGETLKLAVIEAEPVKVEAGSSQLWEEIDALCEKMKEENHDKAWTDIPGVKETRVLYQKCGIDPTKTRPSSEALLRRTVQGKGLYKINNLVDICNWCSLEFQLPIGLYDSDNTKGSIACRFGREGESFPGIRKDDVHVDGRICMADEKGAFGSPTSDSARTMITENTKRAIMVLFALKRTEDSVLLDYLEKAEERIRTFCHGSNFHTYIK